MHIQRTKHLFNTKVFEASPSRASTVVMTMIDHCGCLKMVKIHMAL